MNHYLKHVFLSVAVVVTFVLLAVGGLTVLAQQQTRSSQQEQSKPPDKTDEASEGAKRFAANCGRCHQPPEDISPKEAKAVIRHMRVRANLSAEDERLILKFIAP